MRFSRTCLNRRQCARASLLGVALAVRLASGHAEGLGEPSLNAELGAVIRHDHSVCLRIAHPGLATNTRVLVIRAGTPGGFTVSHVARADSRCAGEGSDTGYRLSIPAGFLADGAVAAAALGQASVLGVHGGSVTVRVPGMASPLDLESCASSDGIHLTAWRGRPRDGVRAWHAYVYLNQDLDPTCSEAETN